MNTNLRSLFLQVMNSYTVAKNQPFRGHPLGAVLRKEIPSEIKQLFFITDDYIVTGSVGQGNWAHVPWIAILHNMVTDTTQKGYYIVYLFSEDMESVYLTIAQGVTETPEELMNKIKLDIRNMIHMKPRCKKDDNVILGYSKRAKDYARSIAAYIIYNRDQMPSEDVLIEDLKDMVGYYEEYIQLKSTNSSEKIREDKPEYDPDLTDQDLIRHITNYIRSKGFYYHEDDVKNFFLSLKTKPFVILSGISGTGKTKMVQLFAESIGATKDNGRFTLIPVRPDWSDSSNLLGVMRI